MVSEKYNLAKPTKYVDRFSSFWVIIGHVLIKSNQIKSKEGLKSVMIYEVLSFQLSPPLLNCVKLLLIVKLKYERGFITTGTVILWHPVFYFTKLNKSYSSSEHSGKSGPRCHNQNFKGWLWACSTEQSHKEPFYYVTCHWSQCRVHRWLVMLWHCRGVITREAGVSSSTVYVS